MMEKCLKEKVCKQERWDWPTWVCIIEARAWKAGEVGSCRSRVKVSRQDLKLTLKVPPTAVVAATVVATAELSNDAAVSHNPHIIGIFHQRCVNLPNKIRRIIARCPTASAASFRRELLAGAEGFHLMLGEEADTSKRANIKNILVLQKLRSNGQVLLPRPKTTLLIQVFWFFTPLLQQLNFTAIFFSSSSSSFSGKWC